MNNEYAKGDKVLKKNISDGIHEGTVEESWSTWLRVKWDTGYHGNCFASSVLPNTDENMSMLMEKWEKRHENLKATNFFVN